MKTRGRAGRVSLVAVVLIAILSFASGSYGAWASGLASSNYQWFTSNSESDVFILSTPGDIYSFAEIVNGTQPSAVNGGEPFDFRGKTIRILTGSNPSISDVPAADSTGKAGELPLNTFGTQYEFEPIGTEEHPFEGTFDGNGAILLNMLIDQEIYGTNNLGLFGVVGEHGTVKNLTVTGNITLGTNQPLTNIGGAVGFNRGNIQNVTSQVNLTIDSSYAPSSEPSGIVTPVNNLGGVIGCSEGSICGCVYQNAKLLLKSDVDAVNETGMKADAVAKGIGGVVGTLGSFETNTPGLVASDCINASDMYLCFTGSGGTDSWGTWIDANATDVGGVVGYSSGSLYRCGNSAEIRTSARNTDSYGRPAGWDTTYENGASKCGGVVGSLRSDDTSEENRIKGHAFDNGCPDDVLCVENCWNTGLIIAFREIGGIAGSAGTYTQITCCSNGNSLADNINIMSDVDTLPHEQGGVISTKWSKPFVGGIAGMSFGDVSYCYNRGSLNCTQSGYYLAGICAGLGSSNIQAAKGLDDANYDCEVFGCYNVGQIGGNSGTNNRYGALVGENYGYVHDCVSRTGCVVAGESTFMGGSIWRRYDNLESFTSAELKSSAALKVLNAHCFEVGDYTFFWFSGQNAAENGGNYNDGFPVMTCWAQPKNGVPIDSSRLIVESVKNAVYTNVQLPGNEPVPTVDLSYYNDDGSIVQLKQNADYLIIPEEGAFLRSDTAEDGELQSSAPYRYSVRGIGLYMGEILDFGRYGIGAGTLEDMTVVVDPERIYNFEVQFPEYVNVFDAQGEQLDESFYSYVIFDSHTRNKDLSIKYPVFDSEGYVIFDDEIDVAIPACEATRVINANAGIRSYKVFDANGHLLSDSTGAVYNDRSDEIGGIPEPILTPVTGSCIGYLPKSENTVGNDGEAGYYVEVRGKSDYEGSSVEGRFVIGMPDLQTDCITTVRMPDGSLWDNDTDDHSFRAADNWHHQADVKPSFPFIATSYQPEVTISWLGRTLIETTSEKFNDFDKLGVPISNNSYADYKKRYGGFEVTDYVPPTPSSMRNRNVTQTEDSRYGASVQGLSKSKTSPITYTPFSGYVSFDFDISPISAEEVDVLVRDNVSISMSSNGDIQAIRDPITLKLGASTLIKGLDYELSYLTANKAVLDGAPTEPGNYYVRVEMLAPNFDGQLATSEFAFEVGKSERFSVQAEPRSSTSSSEDDYPYLKYFQGRCDGDYLEDVSWDVGLLTPSLVFLDAQGEDISDEMIYGVDYEYEIKRIVDGSIPMNRDANSDSEELFPSIYGYSSEVLSSFKWIKNMHGDEPLRIDVRGLGRFEGCELTVFWKINRVDLAKTESEDWRFELANPQCNASKSENVASLPTSTKVFGSREYSSIYYKDKLVYVSNAPGFNMMSCEVIVDDVKPGDVVDYAINAAGVSVRTPFVGMRALNGEWRVEPCYFTASINTRSGLIYDGLPKTPPVANGTYGLKAPDDFSLAYYNNVEAGEALCVATGNYTLYGEGKYGGTRIYAFTIAPRNIASESSDFLVSSIENQTFTSDEVCPKLSVTDKGLATGNDTELVEGVDFELSYTRNVDVGTASVFINGIGNYTGTLERTFEIVPDESNVRLYTEYVDVLNPSRNVQAPTWTDGHKAGETVTGMAPAIEGWHVVPLEEETVTKSIVLSATERNAITFYYLKDGWSLPEEVQDIKLDITVYNTNWYAAAKASVQPTNADQTVLWSTSDVSLAQINSKGYIRAYDDGVVEITAASTRDPEIVGTAQLVIVGQADEPFTMEQSSGVVMDGVPSGSKFVVSRESASSFASKVERGKHVAAAYDVSLYGVEYVEGADGKKMSTGRADTTLPIQPISTVGLKFPVPNGYSADDIEVLHWAEDGTYELEDAVLSDDGSYLVISTDHLSLFTLVAPDDASGTQEPGSNPGNSGDNKPGNDGSNNDGSGNNGGTNNGGTNQGSSVTIGDGDSGTGGKVTIGDGDTGSNVQNPSTNPGNTGSGNTGSGTGGTYVAPNLPSTGTTGNNASAGTNNSTGSTGSQQASVTASNVTGNTGSSGSSESTGSGSSSSRSSSSESGSSATGSSSGSSSSRSDSSSSSSSSRSSSSSSSSSSKADDKNGSSSDTKQVSDKEVTAKVDGDGDVAQTVGITLLVLVALAGAAVGVYFTYIKRPRRTTRRWR